jgi:hypothetical protein
VVKLPPWVLTLLLGSSFKKFPREKSFYFLSGKKCAFTPDVCAHPTSTVFTAETEATTAPVAQTK